MNAVVIIPVYEPEKCLPSLVKELWERGNEILVVDDGSSQESRTLFRELSGQARILRHEKNQGKGAAIRTALQYIQENKEKYSVIGIMDGDGQHLPRDMERLLRRAAAEPESLILGVRQVGEEMPFRSRLGNALTRQIFRLVSGKYISDTQSGLRAFSYGLVEKFCRIQGNRYEYETNVLLYCARADIPVVEIPIETIYMDRENSTSHFHVIRDSFRIYREFLKFLGSSLLSFVLDYILFGFLTLLFPAGRMWLLISNAAARLISAFFNYHMNTKLVFRTGADRSSGLRYALLAAGILFLNNLMLLIYERVPGLPVMGAKLFTEITLFLVSFTVQKLAIFKKTVDNTDKECYSTFRKDTALTRKSNRNAKFQKAAG